jgi:hypothetical protein
MQAEDRTTAAIAVVNDIENVCMVVINCLGLKSILSQY